MDTRSFTYTAPSSIEGEPEEVAEIAIKQARDLAAVVARLSADTFVQLRSAGIDPEVDEAEAAWLGSPAGCAVSDFVWAARVFAEAAKAL
jgi:hypothetical protein